MTFEEQLKTYANLIVSHGMNVQKGQDVYLSGEVIHRDFITLLLETCYMKGARYVHIDLTDPHHFRTKILETQKKDDLSYVPEWIAQKADHLVAEHGASCRILGSEEPDLYEGLDPAKINQAQVAVKKKLANFYKLGIGQSKVQWTIAACPTLKWAKKVFPDLSEKEGYQKLWADILKMCRADRPDCLDLWKVHNTKLQKRAKELTAMKIKTLHFTGPGTDLKVGLSNRAIFKGGGDLSPRGVEYEPNIPTEEVFTTPDFHRTEGIAKATRPFLINGTMIKGLTLEFKEGKIVNFSAQSGEETFREYIASDEGACRLGEVALVGTDSPIFQSGRIYEEILFDENAACHIAVGFAYHFCIKDAPSLSTEELHKYGVNSSCVHTDMMISSPEVSVDALLQNGDKIPLIVKGRWVDAFN